jgi:DNA ligase 1
MTLHRRLFFNALGLLAFCPKLALARKSALPITLAQDAPPDLDPSAYLVSEKYDGVRAYWDGSSLRFRSGLPVAAPAWFLAALPATPLDGELWLARGRFEALVGAVRRQQPLDAEWRAIRYMVFDLPGAAGTFAERAARISVMFKSAAGPVVAVPQQRLASRAALDQQLQAVLAAGGEGLMLHRADAPHTPGRSGVLFKLKPLADAEAQVIGHVPGRGKHVGRLGALRVRTADGVVFLIGTGFSDAEREAPPAIGQWVTFTHRGLTEAGVPRFASYLRPRAI